jgi:dihydroorotate dehydrogenase (fumarate)
MVDMSSTYMGLKLRNPIIAGASTLTSNMETIKKLEEAGAGAIVIGSLFEEQIQLERMELEEDLTAFDNLHPEMIHIFPHLEHAGPQAHLMWVRKAKESVSIPVIASLNAVNRETWVEYAALLEQTGIDGLELNFYATPVDVDEESAAIEEAQIATVRAVKKVLSIPMSVKLSPFYANPLHFVSRLSAEGVDGFVLFNRFFQPDIDTDQEENTFPLELSSEGDYGLALRFAGLLFGTVDNICCSTGIFSGQDVVKMLLAGATCVQVVSTLYKNQISHLGAMVQAIEQWMEGKGYQSLADFRGKLSRKMSHDRWAYTRAQYVRALLKPDPVAQKYRVIG